MKFKCELGDKIVITVPSHIVLARRCSRLQSRVSSTVTTIQTDVSFQYAFKNMTKTDPLKTEFCSLVGCDYPIIQAGMGGVARWELAAAVSAAGAFGCLGMVRESADRIRSEIRAVRQRTDRPFGVNLIPAATPPQLFAQELAACIDENVEHIVYFWDVVPAAIDAAKRGGCKVLYQVGSVEDAVEAEAAGADVIIAQGVEGGGHVHGHVTSLTLLPQVINAVKIPVIASGGFADGASLIAAIALGSAGVHCGTVFVASEESFAHQIHKERIIQARETETVHTDAFAINWPPQSPVRVLANKTTQCLNDRLWGYSDQSFPHDAIAEEEGRPVYRFSTDSPLRSMTGELDQLALFAGQVTGQVNEIRPAAMIVDQMIRHARQRLKQLGFDDVWREE